MTGCNVVLSERERRDADALATVEGLFYAPGASLIRMNPAEHDLHTAYVSHISHVI